MKKYCLKNGLTVIEDRKKTESVCIQVTIKTGSNLEKDGIRGISHFIEHMLFEGTKNRNSGREISNEIESLGGEINAYTDNVRTSFYIKVPKKHFEKAIDIISDIIKNPLFRQKDIDRERKIILKEINIFNDESRFFQWILFYRALFDGHPAKYPAYGTKKDVSSINREKILDYFNKYYNANNSIVSVVGNTQNPGKAIEKYFNDFRKGEKIHSAFSPSMARKPKTIRVKRNILNSYVVLGYSTASRDNHDSYILDVIQAILGRGQSGRVFDEIRNKRGLAYEVGVHHEPSKCFGYFAIYLNTDKENIPLIKKIILKEFEKLGNLSEKELREAIGYVEGRFILDNEDTHNKADSLAFWELIKDIGLLKRYLQIIRKTTKKDVLRVAKKYLTRNYTMAVVEQNK